MTREAMAILLSGILGACTGLAASSEAAGAGLAAQRRIFQKRTIQEQVLEIPAGAVVQVRLTSKEKLRGRLGEISPQGFVLKHAQGSKIEERSLAFDEVKSIKYVERGMSTGSKIALGALAGVGVLYLVLLALVAVIEG